MAGAALELSQSPSFLHVAGMFPRLANMTCDKGSLEEETDRPGTLRQVLCIWEKRNWPASPNKPGCSANR